jgi:hypothetical protein
MRNEPIDLERVGRVGLAALITLSVLGAASLIVRAQETGTSSGAASLVEAIRAMDEALAKGDLRTALRAREDARLAALGSAGWEGLVVLGEATLRLGLNSGLRGAMEPAARRAYLFALYRARRQESIEGVVRVTEAFVAMGDREMAQKACGIAAGLAASGREPAARERVRALQNRLDGASDTSAPTASAAPGSEGAHDHDWRGPHDDR